MFPYAEKEYTWQEWNDAREEAIKCWIDKRNSYRINVIFNTVYHVFRSTQKVRTFFKS